MSKRKVVYAAGLAIQFLSLGCVAQADFSCPDTVKVSSASLSTDSVPTGFSMVTSNSPIHLTGISAYDGPPQQGAALMPASENKAPPAKGAPKKLEKVTISTWNFEGDYPQGKFVSCDYAQGLIRMVAKVSDSAKSCVATTGYEMPYNTLQASFSCK